LDIRSYEEYQRRPCCHPMLPLLLQPTPFGQSVAHILLDNDETIASSSSSVEIWDLGAGLGRDVCFLAEELYHWNTTYPTLMNGKNSHHLPNPWSVIGFDQRYCNVHVNDSIDFWKRRHVEFSLVACRQSRHCPYDYQCLGEGRTIH
jgi:hypothetical protein